MNYSIPNNQIIFSESMKSKGTAVSAVLALLMVVAFSGCQSDQWQDEGDAPRADHLISLSVKMAGQTDEVVAETRGIDITTESLEDLGLIGLRYAAGQPSQLATAKAGDFILDAQVTKANQWKSEYSWPGAASDVALYAYAPYHANGIGVPSSTWTGVPFITYNVPDQAENHQDILVAKANPVNGNRLAAVGMDFDHLCAKVKLSIYCGTVTSAAFKYICDAGTYSFDGTWQRDAVTSSSEVRHTFTYPLADGKEAPDELTFYMIPQTTPAEAVIEVTYADGTIATKAVSGEVWKAGETYEYELYKDDADFIMTGCVQVYKAREAGTYQIECWGASGGSALGYSGGKGAYTSGNITLANGEVLYVHVGENGDPPKTNVLYNNGFSSSPLTDGKRYGQNNGYQCAGGGSTDIRINLGNWDDFESIKSRIMVAAGGGGSNTYYLYSSGGYAGGLTGGNGARTASGTPASRTQVPTGGSQTLGGINGNGGRALFGTLSTNVNISGKGGNGYYAGGHGPHGAGTVGAGAGGSSFISGYTGCNAIAETSTQGNIVHTGQPNHYSGKVFTNSVMIAGNASMTSPSGTTETGHYGNGYCRITKL